MMGVYTMQYLKRKRHTAEKQTKQALVSITEFRFMQISKANQRQEYSPDACFPLVIPAPALRLRQEDDCESNTSLRPK